METATAQMQVVGRRHYGRKAVAAGGGGKASSGAGNSTAREWLTAAILEGTIALDGSGKATVAIPLTIR